MSKPLQAVISRENPDKVFDLIEKVGGGTYGDVFKARVIATGDLAAVKIVKVEPGDDFDLIQQEIAMMQHCQHANIVNYVGSFLRRDKLWIGMEYCGGGSLQDIYCVTGPLSEPQISFVAVETLKGLAYLHSKGLMHRDIKGANILLSVTGDVKLADFGIAARITETMKKRKSFIGTPYWMAPEMAAVERTGGYDLKCDIWAVGITVIEFAELQPPMFDLHPMRALYIISKKNFMPPTLKDKNKWTPEMQHFIKTTLTKNPKKRPGADRMLTHPFCSHNYTKRETQDLLDRFKQKVDASRGTLHMDNSEDDEETVDQEVKILTRIRSKKIDKDENHAVNHSSSSSSKLGTVRLPPMIKKETSPQDVHQNNEVSDKFDDRFVVVNSQGEETGTLTIRSENSDEEDEPPPLPPKNRDSQHYAVPRATLNNKKPAPPPKPAHLKLSRTGSGGALPSHTPSFMSVDNKVRKFSEGSHSASKRNHAPPPTGPPPRLPNPSAMNGFPHGASDPKKPLVACFSKIFNECPLKINCTATWLNPHTKSKNILIGAEEGIYSLNYSDPAHEMEMEQVCSRKCTWLSVVNNIMVSMSGTPPCVIMRNLQMLHDKDRTLIMTMARGIVYSQRIGETRGCLKCRIVSNPYNNQIFLCVLMAKSIILMQWYEPMEKFMKVKTFDVELPSPVPLFEPVIPAELEYPLMCVGVREKSDRSLHFDTVNLNSSSNWYVCNSEGKKIHVDTFDHLEKDTILVSCNNVISFVTLEGKLKYSRRQMAEIHFAMKPDSVVCLQGTVLAFHRHGLEGRSLQTGDVTVEMKDPSRTFRLIGAEGMAVVESRPADNPDAPSNLYILATTPKSLT